MEKERNSQVIIRLSKFFLPFILGFSVIGGVGFLLEESLRIRYWPLVSTYFFPPLGKETVIPLGIASGIPPVIMALSIAFVDVIVALFLLWNYDLAKKIPIVGKFIIKVEEKGKNVEEKYGWVKPLRFIGIVLFVIVPFQGSGGLVGSIVGRLIGMKPLNTFFAISIGAVIGTLLIGFFSNAFLAFARINTELSLALIAVISIIFASYFIFKKLKKKK